MFKILLANTDLKTTPGSGTRSNPTEALPQLSNPQDDKHPTIN